MAIYGLRYGYFSRIGRPLLRNAENSRCNQRREGEIYDYAKAFYKNVDFISMYKARDTRYVASEFKVVSSDITGNMEEMKGILNDNSGVFSIVIRDVNLDLIGKEIDHSFPAYRKMIYGLARRLEKMNMQIFAYNSDEYYVSASMIDHIDSDIADLLMENSVYTREKIVDRAKFLRKKYHTEDRGVSGW